MTPPDSGAREVPFQDSRTNENLPCPHGRASWQHCPHCLGLNQPIPYAAPTSDVNESAVVIGNDLARRILAALEHYAHREPDDECTALAAELRALVTK